MDEDGVFNFFFFLRLLVLGVDFDFLHGNFFTLIGDDSFPFNGSSCISELSSTIFFFLVRGDFEVDFDLVLVLIGDDSFPFNGSSCISVAEVSSTTFFFLIRGDFEVDLDLDLVDGSSCISSAELSSTDFFFLMRGDFDIDLDLDLVVVVFLSFFFFLDGLASFSYSNTISSSGHRMSFKTSTIQNLMYSFVMSSSSSSSS